MNTLQTLQNELMEAVKDNDPKYTMALVTVIEHMNTKESIVDSFSINIIDELSILTTRIHELQIANKQLVENQQGIYEHETILNSKYSELLNRQDYDKSIRIEITNRMDQLEAYENEEIKKINIKIDKFIHTKGTFELSKEQMDVIINIVCAEISKNASIDIRM